MPPKVMLVLAVALKLLSAVPVPTVLPKLMVLVPALILSASAPFTVLLNTIGLLVLINDVDVAPRTTA